MFQPDSSDVHVDSLLTNISIAYANTMYIADSIFPIVPVRKQSDLIPEYDQSHWFRDLAQLRAPGTASRGGGYTVGNSSYFCPRYSFRDEIADETRDNADEPFRLDEEAAEFVTDKMQLRREVNFATANFTTGVWGNDDTGGTEFTQWDDYATSTPLTDFTNYIDEVEARIGREANTVVIGKQVWNKLRWHPDVVDTIKHVQRGVVTEEIFAAMAGVGRLLIGRGIYTTDPEGTAEASVAYSRIWGKHALFLYVPPAPSLRTPAAGYTFSWNRVPNSIQYIVRHRDDEREVDIIEGNTYFAQHVTADRAGTFLSSAVA